MRPAIIKTTGQDEKSIFNNKHLHPKLNVSFFLKKIHTNKIKIVSNKTKTKQISFRFTGKNMAPVLDEIQYQVDKNDHKRQS